MIFEENKITLKDGREAVLRSPCASDAAAHLAYIKKACGETDFLSRCAEEWESVSLESEEKWIESMASSPDAVAIACYVDGRTVGNCEIRMLGGIKTRHRATVGIAILREYWGLGIGSAMFRELMSVAQAREGIEIVELEFIEGNDRARALYEKFGFRIVGERPSAFKLKDERVLTEYFMQKRLR